MAQRHAAPHRDPPHRLHHTVPSWALPHNRLYFDLNIRRPHLSQRIQFLHFDGKPSRHDSAFLFFLDRERIELYTIQPPPWLSCPPPRRIISGRGEDIVDDAIDAADLSLGFRLDLEPQAYLGSSFFWGGTKTHPRILCLWAANSSGGPSTEERKEQGRRFCAIAGQPDLVCHVCFAFLWFEWVAQQGSASNVLYTLSLAKEKPARVRPTLTLPSGRAGRAKFRETEEEIF